MGKSDTPIIEDWKTYRLSFQEQAEAIVAELTTEEKISLMSGRLTREEIRSQILNKKKTHYNETPYWAGGLARKNVMPILFVNGSRGVVCQRGVYTAFPAEILRGATFDRELETEIGAAIAEEVLYAGGNLFGGVCVNLPYHPGWGRMQECYGEDSYLLGEMGSALVRGVQSRGVIACVKHCAFNSMENNRLNVNIVGAPGIVAEREERLLKGFARIHLKENEEQSVTMECPLEELTYFDEESGEMVLEQGTYRIFVEDLQAEILIK